MLENLPRWLFASVSKHFTTLLPNTIIIFIEGQHVDVSSDIKDKVEIRMDGPYVVEIQRDSLYEVTVEINLLLSSYMSDTDFHKLHRLQGKALACFTGTIPVYKYGSGDDDDNSFIGCLALKSNMRGTRADWIQVTSFGQVEKDTKLQQSSIEAHYSMRISS